VTTRGRDAVLQVRGLRVRYASARRSASDDVLRGVDLSVHAGEIVGVIGETGSGKTTLARAIVGLVDPIAGSVGFGGRDISALHGRARRAFRRAGGIQLVFQDPLRSLDPDLTVESVVAEGLAVRGGVPKAERRRRVQAALELVGLDPSLASRRPGEISGGQRQRVSLARAVVLEPRLLICDEPVSALDASNRNYILRILGELRDRLEPGLIVISHDLGSLAGVADRIAVMYRGRIVEEGPIGDVFAAPAHPYTALLIASAPHLSRARLPFDLEPGQIRRIPAEVTRALGGCAFAGCAFAQRCRFATEQCVLEQPEARQLVPGHPVECHHAETWKAQARSESSNGPFSYQRGALKQ
jgi:oligopeptide/dipeptide ABC transporter ATP-binding protein